MGIKEQLNVVEDCLIEVRGQIQENGAFVKEAVRQLSEAVELLRELSEGGE